VIGDLPQQQQETCIQQSMTSSQQGNTLAPVVRPAEEAFRFRVLSLYPGGLGIAASAFHRIMEGKPPRTVGRWRVFTRRRKGLASPRRGTCEHIAQLQRRALMAAAVDNKLISIVGEKLQRQDSERGSTLKGGDGAAKFSDEPGQKSHQCSKVLPVVDCSLFVRNAATLLRMQGFSVSFLLFFLLTNRTRTPTANDFRSLTLRPSM
jgi:hypothetical protein